MAREIYDTATLAEVMEDQDEASNYWMDLCFNAGTLNFDNEWVDFTQIPDQGRPLAPFVTPLSQGRPIFSESAKIARFKPAYIKPKDPITPTRVLARRGKEILARTPDGAADRYDAIVADITAFHRRAIERTWEWLAAQAVLYGSVTIKDEDFPERILNFGRAAGNTIVLGGGSRWGDVGISPLDNVESWADVMFQAEFGGTPTRLTLGTSAWAKFKEDPKIKDLLDTTYRGETGVEMMRGPMVPSDIRRVGSIMQGSVEVYVYRDYYTVGGSQVPFMDPRDAVLTGPGLRGWRCFGAILDPHAEYQALDIYSRMWMSDDPPATFIMTQSAPLMVPMAPNNSLRARVVA